MQGLTLTELQIFLVRAEVALEVRNWFGVRIVITDTKPTSYINVVEGYAFLFKAFLQIVYAAAESLEIVHYEYLRPDMEMQSYYLHMAHLLGLADDVRHTFHSDAKLVLSQSGSDVGMSMCAYIRIDAQLHTHHLTIL